MFKSAELSSCGEYRYILRRRWNGPESAWPEGPPDARWVCFVGLNPSTADAIDDDQTIRKLIGFSKRWGFDGFKIVNLFALRSRDPAALRGHAAPQGPANEEWITAGAVSSVMTVVCWGAHAMARARGPQVVGLLRAHKVRPKCFGKAAGGAPLHPLRLPYSTQLCDL